MAARATPADVERLVASTASRASRWSTPPATSRATCTSRTCCTPTRRAVSSRCRPSGSARWPPSARDDEVEDVLPTMQLTGCAPGPGGRPRRRGDRAWSSSRTSSRSWSARCPTPHNAESLGARHRGVNVATSRLRGVSVAPAWWWQEEVGRMTTLTHRWDVPPGGGLVGLAAQDRRAGAVGSVRAVPWSCGSPCSCSSCSATSSCSRSSPCSGRPRDAARLVVGPPLTPGLSLRPGKPYGETPADLICTGQRAFGGAPGRIRTYAPASGGRCSIP